MSADQGISQLGEFWLPGSQPASGSLSLANGSPLLELIGCFAPDSADGSATVDFPRQLPVVGDEHPIVCGVLRDGMAITLVGTRGFAVDSMRFVNGRSWSNFDLSGDARLRGRYAVLDTVEDTEPLFDAIEFTCDGLASFLGRSRSWYPFDVVDSLHGYVPIVVPKIPPLVVELPSGRILTCTQVIRSGPRTALRDVAESRFQLTSSAQMPFPEVLTDLIALHRLAEFATGIHQPLRSLAGIRKSDSYDHRFPIVHLLQHEIEGIDQGRPHFTFKDLTVGAQGEKSIDRLAAETVASDPRRGEYLHAWTRWFAHAPNADAMSAYLEMQHRPSPATIDVLRSTIGALEHLTSNSAEPDGPTRVSPLHPDEIADRDSVIRWIESHAAEHELSWALETLKGARVGKGLGRRMRELFDSQLEAIGPILRPDRWNASSDGTSSAAKETATALTRLRGAGSHGTGQVADAQLDWRIDQARLVFVAVVLAEIGVPAECISTLVQSHSTNERWWDGR